MLQGLQTDQLQHDLRAHVDIVCLRLPEKLRHFTFHLAKYCGRLSRPENRLANLHATAVDAFIIGLATCNALGLAVQPDESAAASEAEIPITAQEAKSSLAEEYFLDLVNVTGRMAKVCESFDHLEEIAYRRIVTSAAIELCQITLKLYEKLGENVEEAVRHRWAEIERRR